MKSAGAGSFFKLEDFVPSLREAVEKQPLDLNRMIMVGVPVKDLDQHPRILPASTDRHALFLVTGKNVCPWETRSLRALFRGDRKPPLLGDYPEAYNESFMLLDLHALEISKFFGDRRDDEMLEIYSALRRRPDGRSLGFVHDYMWQAAALMLGVRPLSQAEYEAILERLERSCRTFSMGPTSRNYIATLRSTLGQGGSSR
jgi:hypothetical protein